MRTRTSPRLKSVFTAAAIILGTGLLATQAVAECDETQEALVGKAIAAAATAKIGAVVPGAGKQMINIEACEAGSAGLVAEFKYNVIGSDGLYWATGTAKVAGKDVKDLSFKTLSPNLASVSSAKGVKLASN